MSKANNSQLSCSRMPSLHINGHEILIRFSSTRASAPRHGEIILNLNLIICSSVIEIYSWQHNPSDFKSLFKGQRNGRLWVHKSSRFQRALSLFPLHFPSARTHFLFVLSLCSSYQRLSMAMAWKILITSEIDKIQKRDLELQHHFHDNAIDGSIFRIEKRCRNVSFVFPSLFRFCFTRSLPSNSSRGLIRDNKWCCKE